MYRLNEQIFLYKMSAQINSQIIGVSFGVINSDEVKKLSVLDVQTEKTFDELSHARIGGLCDNVFGIELKSLYLHLLNKC